MTNPNDPWGQRPEEQPTEHLGGPGKSGFDEPLHTTEYTEAYGQGAPPAYPATEQFQWAPPPNATREFPTYDSQWSGGAYPPGYGEQWSGQPGQGGGVPPGAPPPFDQQPPPPKRNTGLWVLLGIGVILLVAAAGVVAGVLLGGSNSSDTAAPASTTSVRTPPTALPTPSGPRPTVVPSIPGLGDIDALGATMGTISANDGGTLTISTLLGSTVTVRTDERTEVIAADITKAADLPTGELVVVQGDKSPDGSILARVIISAALPGPPR